MLQNLAFLGAGYKLSGYSTAHFYCKMYRALKESKQNLTHIWKKSLGERYCSGDIYKAVRQLSRNDQHDPAASAGKLPLWSFGFKI